MANLSDRIKAEIDNVRQVLDQLPSPGAIHRISPLELAGIATLLHNFYNGVENVIKQIMHDNGWKVPDGPTWHRDLLDAALKRKIIRRRTHDLLKEYLAFRHFFVHGYAFQLDPDRIFPLFNSVSNVWHNFQKDFEKYLD